MPDSIKKIWSAFTTLLVIALVIIAILLVGVRVAGLRVYSVLSGSMEPSYHVGSIIYVKEVDPFTLKKDDVITFMLNENTVATHRIYEVVPDKEDKTVVRFATKGDANSTPDGGLVHYKNVIGTPVFTIPYLGYLASFIQNPPGTYYAIAIAIVIVLLAFVPDLFDDDEEDEEAPDKKGKEASF